MFRYNLCSCIEPDEVRVRHLRWEDKDGNEVKLYPDKFVLNEDALPMAEKFAKALGCKIVEKRPDRFSIRLKGKLRKGETRIMERLGHEDDRPTSHGHEREVKV